MKALKNHVILFDAECPMCRMYTEAFVKTGMLDTQGRSSYQQMPEIACPFVDRQRAADEIALVNTSTGEISYGVESLFKVLGNAMPVLNPLFTAPPFVWLMSKLYAFISFNRRIIIPPAADAGKSEFQPSFRLKYRLIYFVVAWLITSFILSRYTPLLNDLIKPGAWYREYLICGGQIIFQGLIVICLQRNKLWDYLGNMMTISLAGALMLIPVLAISSFASFSSLFYALWFVVVAGLMFAEHMRRMKLTRIAGALSFTWFLYRLLLLAFLAR